MNQEARWSARFGAVGDEYLFGTAPNRYLTRHAALFAAGGRALSVADGEGRNAVWLAEQGLAVTAVEISPVALRKAHRLTADRGVEVDFRQQDMLVADWPAADLRGAFDFVVAIFIQFVGPELRARQFEALRAATRPGGRIVLQGYTPRQLEYATGGPAQLENLYTAAMLREAFADWEIEELVEYEDDVAEGSGHCGRSALIGMVARRPQEVA